MDYLLCKHSVADLDGWRDVFDYNEGARRKAAGLKLLHIIRCSEDPNLVFLLFRVEDINEARAFAKSSGECGAEEIKFLSE